MIFNNINDLFYQNDILGYTFLTKCIIIFGIG
jgi:hypothetical protein